MMSIWALAILAFILFIKGTLRASMVLQMPAALESGGAGGSVTR